MERQEQYLKATVIRAGQTVYVRAKQEDGQMAVVDTVQCQSINQAKHVVRNQLKQVGGFAITVQTGETFNAGA